MVPVDGGYTMAQVDMVRVLGELKARIILPMHYFGPDTLARFIGNAEADFPAEFASDPVLVVSAKTLPGKPKIIVLPGN